MRSAVVLVVAGLALCGSATATAAAGPRLSITAMRPFTVHGASFHARERVRVVIRRAGRAAVTHRVRAGRHGRFSAAFGSVRLGHCGGFTVTATGSRGSHATLVRFQPDCMLD